MQEMNQRPYPQQPYGCIPPVELPVRKMPYFGTNRNGIVFALILLCLCIFCANSFIYVPHPGLGASSFTVVIFFTLAVFLCRQKKAVTFYGVFACFAYLAFAVSFSVTGSNVFFVVNALFVLSGVIYMEFMQLRRREGFRSIGDLCYTLFVLTFGRIHYAVYALFHSQTPDGIIRKRKTSGVFLGIVIAVPFLIIIIPLLILSDAAFENLLSGITISTVIEIVVSVFFGILVFTLLFGRALCAPHNEPKMIERQNGNGIDPVIVVTFLSMISAIYVVYLVSQLAYFFNAFAGLLPKGYSVAEYARRGFFEMTVICAINLLIVFLANLLCRKNNEKTPGAVQILSLFLCVFSLILAATVLSKIGLYIHSFGMTRMRILTSLFTILLIVVFISVAIRLFRKNVPYMKIALVAASVLLLLATYADTDRLVVSYNIHAYQNGTLSSIDMKTIEELHSHTVVPYVFELIDDENSEVSKEAKDILSENADRIFRITASETPAIVERWNTDWRAWNYTENEAAKLLEREFYSYYTGREYR